MPFLKLDYESNAGVASLSSYESNAGAAAVKTAAQPFKAIKSQFAI